MKVFVLDRAGTMISAKSRKKDSRCFGAFTFVVKCQFFVCPAGKLHKIEMVRLERCAELTGFLGVEATFLELHAVDLDAEDEVLGNTRPDALSDFYDEARAVG